MGFIPIFGGEYELIDEDWYDDVGRMITMTLIGQIYAPHLSKLGMPFVKLYKRWRDRGMTFDLKVETKVNTKLSLQDDLNALYTGDQIASHFVYAQTISFLFCIMLFSTGMPYLYFLAAVCYTVLYWVYKFLILKFYMRSNRFNEGLPLAATDTLKAAIICHMTWGFVMILTNTLAKNPVKQYGPCPCTEGLFCNNDDAGFGGMGGNQSRGTCEPCDSYTGFF